MSPLKGISVLGMHLRSGLLLSGLVAVLLAFARPAEAKGPGTPASGQLVRATFHSRALEGNLLGDSADQEVHVYLPPSYATSPKRRYPVVYLLHGYGGSPGDWTQGGLVEHLDALMNTGALPELILVVPNGRNRYGGSFYMDSPVTGGWEQYVVKELVAHVDGTYRTLARPESRGLTGHSMGGFGAVRLGMRHPDVFGAVYAMSPCCLDLEEDLSAANDVWRRMEGLTTWEAVQREARRDIYPMLLTAMAAAVSPNPERPPLRMDLPFRVKEGRVVPVEPVLARWREAFPLQHLDAPALRKLRGLGFDVGTRDGFAHIPTTTRRLSQELSRLGVPHVYELYEGTHNSRVRERFFTRVLPFFAQVLAAEK